MYKKTAIYARISVRHLKRKEGSIQSQIQCCKSWIIKEMPKETAYQVYVDEGYSGKDFFRPAWQQLIRDCQNGKDQLSFSQGSFAYGKRLFASWRIYGTLFSGTSDPSGCNSRPL